MIKKDIIVQIIDEKYRKDNYLQVMVPYKDRLVIIGKEGILYKDLNDEDIYSSYLDDDRRYNFPYHDVPFHKTRVGFRNIIKYTNQIFNINESYLCIGDGTIVQEYCLNSSKGPLIVNKIVNPNKKSQDIINREELEELFKAKILQGKYVIRMDENYNPDSSNYLMSEEEITFRLKEFLRREIKRLEEEKENNYTIRKLLDNTLLSKYLESGLDIMDLSKLEVDIPLDKAVIMYQNNNDIDVILVIVNYISNNKYKVINYKIPLDRYSANMLMSMDVKIERAKEPRISLKRK